MSLVGRKHPSVFSLWHRTHLLCMLRDPTEGYCGRSPSYTFSFLLGVLPPSFERDFAKRVLCQPRWRDPVSQHPCLCANLNTHKCTKGSDKSCSGDTSSVFPRFVCSQNFFLSWPFPYPMHQSSGNTLWDPPNSPVFSLGAPAP